MDIDWMRDRLVAYLTLCDRLASLQRSNGYSWTDQSEEINKEALLQLSTVQRIVSRLEPEAPTLMPPSYSSSDSALFVRKALGALGDIEDVDRALAPDSPALNADALADVVWRSASAIWETGEYKTAVQQAAVALSAHIKKRSGSALNDRKLVQQVFSPESAKPGQSRLHFPGDHGDESWQSRQQGLHLLSQGAFAGIRNIAAHDEVQWTEQEGLEHLAVLSVVARWASQTELVKLD